MLSAAKRAFRRQRSQNDGRYLPRRGLSDVSVRRTMAAICREEGFQWAMIRRSGEGFQTSATRAAAARRIFRFSALYGRISPTASSSPHQRTALTSRC
jgi:hypothetical protein